MLALQTPLLIVHLSTYVLPATPVNGEVGLLGVTIVPPAPEKILHDPVPIAGVFAPSVALVPQSV